MKKKKTVYKITREKLLLARKRRLKREDRGTDEVYMQHIIEQYRILEPFRNRVNIYH